jgi:ABC-type lipoprotein release transport system permease subunit
MALGAARHDVLRLILARGAMLATAGIAIGVAAAVALSRLLESLLYETPPRDPATYAVVCAGLWAVALLASVIPGLRGSRIDPMTALRFE